jgi:hypothetical protein
VETAMRPVIDDEVVRREALMKLLAARDEA